MKIPCRILNFSGYEIAFFPGTGEIRDISTGQPIAFLRGGFWDFPSRGLANAFWRLASLNRDKIKNLIFCK